MRSKHDEEGLEEERERLKRLRECEEFKRRVDSKRKRLHVKEGEEGPLQERKRKCNTSESIKKNLKHPDLRELEKTRL